MVSNKYLVGERFGRLVVCSKGENSANGHKMWNCICDCGTEKLVYEHLLIRSRSGSKGGTKSCGCLNRETRSLNGKNNRKRDVCLAAVYNKYKKYQGSALKRGLQFDLSESDFFNVATLPCAYCGCLPKEEQYRTRGSENLVVKIMSGVFIHGIDRVDNSIGYVKGNLAPCCGDCNRAKGKLAVNEFKSLINRQHAFMFNKSKETYMGLDTQDVSYREAA